MIHFIAFTKIADQKIVYHFTSDDIDKIFDKQDEFDNVALSYVSSSYSVHVLKTGSSDFCSVVDLDPYFKDATVYYDIDLFFRNIDDSLTLTAVDVASYLYRKFRFNSFALEKVLYYIYAETLEKLKNKFFKANFVAFEGGPVDNEVYKVYTHEKNTLIKNEAFDLGILKRKDKKEILSLIDNVAEKYGRYYDSIWEDRNDPSKNLTHKKGTPWYIAKHDRGYNGAIYDSDIRKYHELEKM